MNRIVIAIDGSAFSRQALAWAQELAKLAPAPTFHLVHAYQVAIPVTASVHSFTQARERARKAGDSLLEETRAKLVGQEVELHLVDSPPAGAILDVAKEIKADLVAVGRRGLAPAAGLFLGSVSADILHRSKVPALVVHDAPPRTLQSVLVGVDDSPHSTRALAFAAQWAQGAKLTALHVTPVPARGSVDRVSQEIVARTAERAGVPIDRLRVLGLPGNPVEAVVQEFRSGDYDLAVVGSRGLGAMGELLLGSVSERLSRLAHGAVVVVK